MNIDHMIKMANEIADFFEGESAKGQAPKDVATHLRRYWEPRMRREIIAHYVRGAAGLSDIAREAVGLLAAEAAAAAPPQRPPQGPTPA
ncbi:MAG TPA: formate dehydrogenase subunit delta [Steroidobacteraceae bacterium]|nr:formate dehydrogenase subunit delta [Steroidobacteraceae bacterium]